MTRTYGYARVSTDEQDLTVQREALTKAGCDHIEEEKRSGTTREGRERLDILMKFMAAGDTLVVTRIDRLARSMRDLQNIVHELKAKGVALKATEQPIDTSTAAGKAFLDMLGVFAEFETNLRRERQIEGIRRAVNGREKREKSNKLKYAGRAPLAARVEIKADLAAGMKPKDVAAKHGVALSSVYNVRAEKEAA